MKLLLIVFASFWPPQVAGQEGAQARGPAERLATEIDLGLGAVEANTSLSSELRGQLSETYQQARIQLEQRASWLDRARGFRQETESAPDLAARARAELARPTSDALPLPLADHSPLAEAERGLEAAQLALEAARDARDGLQQTAETRNLRSIELAKLLGERKLEATTIANQLDVLLGQTDPSPAQQAQRLLLQAKALALEAEIDSHQSEATAYDATTALVALQRELAEKRLAEAEARLAAWSNTVEERRQRETTKAAREVEAATSLVARAGPDLRPAAEQYLRLAEQRSEIVRLLEGAAGRQKQAEAELLRVRGAFEDARRRIEVAGLTDAVGILLRKQKNELPNLRDLRRRAVQRKEEFVRVQLVRIDLENLQERMRADELLPAPAPGSAPRSARSEERPPPRTEADALLASYRRLVPQAIADADRLFRQLLDLEQTEYQLLTTSEEFGGYINERILWVRSGLPLWQLQLADCGEALAWLLAPESWRSATRAVWRDAARSPLSYLSTAAALVGLLGLRSVWRRRLREVGVAASSRTCRSLVPTLRATLLTGLLVVPVPLLVWLLGWRLSGPLDAPAACKALGLGLRGTALPLLLVLAVAQGCRRGGLGEMHFDWPAERLRGLRRRLLLLTSSAIPLYFVVSTLEAHDEPRWRQSLGGIALVAALAILAYLLYDALFRSHGARDGAQAILSWCACLLPLVLATVASAGFIFTTLELTRRLLLSFGLILTTGLIYAVVRRWLLVARRRIRRDQALARRQRSKDQDPGEAEIPIEEERVDLETATLQSRLLLRNVLALGAVLAAWFVWIDVLPALRVFDQVTLWTTTATEVENVTGVDGTQEVVSLTTLRPVTLGNVLFALLILLTTYYATRSIPSFLEFSILQRLSVGAGERYAVASLTRYAITLTGMIAAFGVIGIGWAKVQWLAAAITVGLGFGLQEIFGNFVSGLIILFERPVRVGDYVTVGETDGRVTRIRIRATTITDWDLREMIVPNKEFITSRLVNWTLSNPITRVVFPVGIAYGSNTEEARRLLLEIARQAPLALKDPVPSAVFVGMGDSTLEMHLRVFLENRDNWAELVTGINTEIHDRFGQAGIEIAFPQRDLHLRSIGPLEDLVARHPGLRVEEIGPGPPRPRQV